MRAIDPHTNKVIEEHKPLPDKIIQQKIELSYQSFLKHSKTDLETRKKKILRIAEILEERAEKYGSYITREMGKPITESIAEVKKAAKNFRFVHDNLESFLQSDYVKTDFKESRVDYQPLGPIYFITPYNFPFWLSVKGAGPALAMGNTVLLKTASSCPRSGLCVEEAIRDAGFDNNEFQHLFATQEQSELVISNPLIRGVSFTGSTKGGAEIAALAGKYTKKSILELGGSDPCVLMPDADIETALKVVYNSRMRNDGQVCSCIKRLIVHEGVYDEFKDMLIEKLKKVKIGDPMKKETEVGPIGVKRIYEKLMQEIEEGKKQGAKILYGGCRPEGDELAKGNYLLPTVLECDEKNVLWNEEIFGPVFPLIKYNDLNEALRMANQTKYGLGAVVIGKDTKKADNFAKDIVAGAVGINETVQTDPRLPSGGVKDSGYGRECGVIGAREFVNCKTIMIR